MFGRHCVFFFSVASLIPEVHMANSILLIIVPVLSIIFYKLQVKACTRLSAVAFRHALDTMALKMIALQSDGHKDAVDVESTEQRKQTLIKNVDLLGTLNGMAVGFQGMIRLLLPAPFVLLAAQISELFFNNKVPLGAAFKAQPFVILPAAMVLLAAYAVLCAILMLIIRRKSDHIKHAS